MRAVSSVLWVALCAAVLTTGASSQQLDLHRASRRIMGTFCEIQVASQDGAAANRAIAAALDEMERVDRLLSNYLPTSELSVMNREAAKGPFRVSEELFDFVRASHDYFLATNGAFDPTVGPLVKAWGFFTATPAKPDDGAIAEAKARSGFAHVKLDAQARAVAYDVAGLEFDPGGIGKGYAVDRAVAVLRKAGVTSALVSAGGSSLYGIGQPPGRTAWKLGIGDPEDREQPVRYVWLKDASVSTSGVSQKFVVADGHRYSHLFDPRTGWPVEGMCQASVIADTATASDALTKAAFVLRRAEVERLFETTKRVHVLRMEGACGPGRTVWVTPWSSGLINVGSGPKL